MGIFKKRSSEPEAPDAHLSFFTVAEADDFRGIVREAFAEQGLEVVIHPDHAVDDSRREFGFWNVGAQCADARRSEWDRIVREHVQRLLASMDGQGAFEGLERDEAGRRTFVRLYAEADVPTLDRYPHREFVPGIVEMLALDRPETVAFYRHEDAKQLGGWEDLRARGLANLRSLPVESLETLGAPEGGSFHVLLGDSVFTGSRALMLPELATQPTGEAPTEFGWLMSIPNRHQLVWHMVRDNTLVSVLNGMAHFAILGYREAPGPVSPHVYWWDGTAYEQLTHIEEDGTVSVHAGPAFTEVLDALMGSMEE